MQGFSLISHPSHSDPDPERPSSLDEMEDRLKRGREAAGLDTPARQAGSSSAAGKALHASIEFVVATCVGAALGYFIGAWAGNAAIGLVVGLFVGFAAGIRGIIRMGIADAARQNEERDGHGRGND